MEKHIIEPIGDRYRYIDEITADDKNAHGSRLKNVQGPLWNYQYASEVRFLFLMPCLAVWLLLKDQIVQHNLPRCISGIVHRSDPRQLVSGLHMLRNALRLRHLLN